MARCRNCGQERLRWQSTREGWRLFGGPFMHLCGDARPFFPSYTPQDNVPPSRPALLERKPSDEHMDASGPEFQFDTLN